MVDRVTIYEVSPRDGLQNEKRQIPTADKIALIDRLSACGFAYIEAASFVSPKWVPQMADGAAVLAGIARRAGRDLRRAYPQPQGLRGGPRRRRRRGGDLRLGLRIFSRANINASVAESLERFAPVAESARCDGMPLRGYVSCVTDCPFEGPVDPGAVSRVAARLFSLGCREVSLGETLGRATPETVAAMLRSVLAAAPAERLAGHFHDTARPGAGKRFGRAGHGASGVRRLRRRPRRLPLRAGRRRQRRHRAWSPRCSPTAASRPASTPGGWPRPPPSHVHYAPPNDRRSAAFHRVARLSRVVANWTMSNLFFRRDIDYGRVATRTRNQEEPACRIERSSSSRPMRGSTSV